MGQQQSSKSQAPLTFGYINQRSSEEQVNFAQYVENGRDTPDFVRDNPHLYKLELTCSHCNREPQVVVAEGVNTTCRDCNKNKRLSLVRHDLENDLNYIDETYYPNLVHYEEEEEEEERDDENISNEEEGDREEGWSALTMAQVSPPKRLVSPQLSVDLSGKSLIKLSSSIGYLTNLTKLDLSDNQMINLPSAIGQLKNLRILNASKNQLESIPDSINSLHKLKAMNLSQNKLTGLPKGIGRLPSLIILILNQNELKQLPREIALLQDLITLNISNNPLKSIPAEIAMLKSLRKLTAENCAFESEFVFPLTHDPPSLFEICARKISTDKIPLPARLGHITDYFKREQTCSFCYGPYFDSFVTRGKFIERTNRQLIALDYKLCAAHWSDENDRISAMFSTPHERQPQVNLQVLEEDGLLTPMEEIDHRQDYFGSIRSSQTTLHADLPPPTSSSHSLFHSPLLASQENLILPFATLNSRQSHQVDQILASEPEELSTSRRMHKKPNRVIKEGFASLSVRLGRRPRDRSDTV
ncbi:hypothetical protein INT47_012034 [Mucor saturninus]|uniref:Disease resistance R13L4/SHOC-2-like LRR domain-containing protein n=1 Tax=Mucor saturninus TaxID=64648 RepID=A0A8H7QNP6_9FUNG|nr:hypothetical protein INT47_012034 [Mucor saturninus]